MGYPAWVLPVAIGIGSGILFTALRWLGDQKSLAALSFLGCFVACVVIVACLVFLTAYVIDLVFRKDCFPAYPTSMQCCVIFVPALLTLPLFLVVHNVIEHPAIVATSQILGCILVVTVGPVILIDGIKEQLRQPPPKE